ncbi:hypothetical protein GC176_28255 [bacterium]|nr:hypothetical protein [bacterium]
MRDIVKVGRVFALIAVFGLSAVAVGCGQPDNGGGSGTAPATDLGGAEAGSSLGGGAEVPEAGEEAAPATEEAAPAEEAPAKEEAAPAEEAPAKEESAPAKEEAPAEKAE